MTTDHRHVVTQYRDPITSEARTVTTCAKHTSRLLRVLRAAGVGCGSTNSPSFDCDPCENEARLPQTTPSSAPAAPVAAQEPDQAPVDPEGDDRRHTATTTDILDKDLRSALGRKAQRAARASQDATGPQEGAGRIGWLRLKPVHRFRYLAREVDGGWSDKDHDTPVWSHTDWPDAAFTPLDAVAGLLETREEA